MHGQKYIYSIHYKKQSVIKGTFFFRTIISRVPHTKDLSITSIIMRNNQDLFLIITFSRLASIKGTITIIP